jgi:hypothetical protein
MSMQSPDGLMMGSLPASFCPSPEFNHVSRGLRFAREKPLDNSPRIRYFSATILVNLSDELWVLEKREGTSDLSVV